VGCRRALASARWAGIPAWRTPSGPTGFAIFARPSLMVAVRPCEASPGLKAGVCNTSTSSGNDAVCRRLPGRKPDADEAKRRSLTQEPSVGAQTAPRSPFGDAPTISASARRTHAPVILPSRSSSRLPESGFVGSSLSGRSVMEPRCSPRRWPRPSRLSDNGRKRSHSPRRAACTSICATKHPFATGPRGVAIRSTGVTRDVLGPIAARAPVCVTALTR